MFDEYTRERMNSFYMGKLYPLVICALIFAGHALGIEVFLLPVVVILGSLSFWVCDSIRPLFVPLCTFLFSFSKGNSLFGPVSSDYYVTGWRIVAFVLLIILAFVSLCAFIARHKLFTRIFTRKTPLLFSLIILSVAFMLNGAGSEKWNSGNLVYASFQVVAFLVVFVLSYHGFSDDEDAEELAEYFSYITMLFTILLALEMLLLYVVPPGVMIDGEVKKWKIVFGWGVSNNAGSYISVLIPMNFYGAYKSKHPIWYTLSAVAAYVAAILTLSRNALICSTVAFFVCFLLLCFAGKRKVLFRFMLLGIVICAVIVSLNYHTIISKALASYASQGFDDTGRFDIWLSSIKQFFEAPLFGNGFHSGLDTGNQTAGFIPAMAHNTILQLLYSMGIFGFLAYAFYRYRTVLLFVRRPSIMKTLLGGSMLILLFGGLFDNFVFHIQPVFYYSIGMAIACKSVDEDNFFVPILKELPSRW